MQLSKITFFLLTFQMLRVDRAQVMIKDFGDKLSDSYDSIQNQTDSVLVYIAQFPNYVTLSVS